MPIQLSDHGNDSSVNLGDRLRRLDRRVIQKKPATLRSDLIGLVAIFGFFALIGVALLLAGHRRGGWDELGFSGLGFAIWMVLTLDRYTRNRD